MLKRLRLEFTAITMAIVGAVLAAALSISFYSTYTTQHALTESALEHSISRPLLSEETFGRMGGTPEGAGMLVYVVELSSDFVILHTNDAPVTIDDTVLADIVSHALSSSSNSGERKDLGIAWMLVEQQDGYRVAIADVSTRDALLRTQLVHDLVIFCGTMLVLLLIVTKLSRWVVRPVEEAWNRQRTFIADASHELKTPLSVILANTQILQADPSLTPESMRWVDGTADEAQRMKELVSELLELARTDESAASGSAVTAIREDCDLSKLVDGATLEFDAIAYERGCEIESSVEPGIHISCDRAWIERVVKILLDNGTKYADQGSVVRATLSQEGHRVRFSVTNHGNVISPEDLEHVFDRFYRTDRARQREENGGFGLGLAIAKGIVDAHGGQIHATSSEEEGTTFSIVL